MIITEYREETLMKMLKYREAAGYAIVTYKVTIMPFISFCCENYPDADSISRELVDGWLSYKGYSINTQAVFIACLRQYCRYINFLGYKAYVPDEDYVVTREWMLSTCFHTLAHTWDMLNLIALFIIYIYFQKE